MKFEWIGVAARKVGRVGWDMRRGPVCLLETLIHFICQFQIGDVIVKSAEMAADCAAD